MSLKPAPAVPNPISSPSSSSTSSAVVLITNATSPLARALARTLLLSWSPQALVLVDDDNDDGALAEVYEELVQLAWAVGDGAGAGAGSSGEDVGVQALASLELGSEGTGFPPKRAVPTQAGRSFSATVLSDRIVLPATRTASAAAQVSLQPKLEPEPRSKAKERSSTATATATATAVHPTHIRPMHADLTDFSSALRAVKETVAGCGRLDYVFAFPGGSRREVENEEEGPSMSTADFIPILSKAPYRCNEQTASNHSSAPVPESESREKDLLAPRVRARPPSSAQWEQFDALVRRTVVLLHAAVPALVCPARVPGRDRLGFGAGGGRAVDGDRGAGEDESWLGGKYFVLVTLPSSGGTGRLPPSPFYSAATTASLEFLHSYSRLLPEPVLGPNLPHPPIPRIRFGALVTGPACGSTSSSDRLRTVEDGVDLVLRLVKKMGGGGDGGEGGGKMERDVVVLEVPPS